MTLSDSGDPTAAAASPASSSERPSAGYGNIYTPHAGSMIIHVQRESGLQSRMIVLGPRRVRLLRFLMSRTGKILVAGALLVLLILVVEAARVPALMHRMARMEHTAARLDSLERSLGQLQQRYDQVRSMMGADSNSALNTAHLTPRATVPLPATAPRVGAPVSPDADVPAAAAAGADPTLPTAPAIPVRARRRHPPEETPLPKDSADAAPPDTGAAPNPAAEPQ